MSAPSWSTRRPNSTREEAEALQGRGLRVQQVAQPAPVHLAPPHDVADRGPGGGCPGSPLPYAGGAPSQARTPGRVASRYALVLGLPMVRAAVLRPWLALPRLRLEGFPPGQGGERLHLASGDDLRPPPSAPGRSLCHLRLHTPHAPSGRGSRSRDRRRARATVLGERGRLMQQGSSRIRARRCAHPPAGRGLPGEPSSYSRPTPEQQYVASRCDRYRSPQ